VQYNSGLEKTCRHIKYRFFHRSFDLLFDKFHILWSKSDQIQIVLSMQHTTTVDDAGDVKIISISREIFVTEIL
jgi:hypothetical protein